MKFKRTNKKTKLRYYRIFVLVESLLLGGLFYLGVHWLLLFCIIPFILIDIWSNLRCATRQKKHIQQIEITDSYIMCSLANQSEIQIPLEKALFSIREEKFEKDQTEIEIRLKRSLKSKLIGRIHISNWDQIFEIKSDLVKNNVTQIKYRPEGYWSKYGTLTADVILTGATLASS